MGIGKMGQHNRDFWLSWAFPFRILWPAYTPRTRDPDMPRTYWEAKNPYCRRSKLTKEQFEKVSYFYFLEVTVGMSRHACVDMLLAGEEENKLSRQSISLYFDAMGDFLWQHIVVASNPRYTDKSRLDGLLAYLYNTADTLDGPYDLVKMFLERVGLERKKNENEQAGNFWRNVMIEILKRRSAVMRGFADGQFYREVGRTVFICAVVEARGVELKSIEDFFTYPRIKTIARMAWTVLLDILERHPLDRLE